MKTSNKLISGAFILIIISLLMYDLMLKRSYALGNYKYLLANYTTLNFKDFSVIEINAATAANMVVEQGPFNVKMESTASDFIKVSQTADTLRIDAAFSGSFHTNPAPYILAITCPNLSLIKTDARYNAGDQLVVDTLASEDFSWRPSVIRGFTLDSLSIVEDHATTIVLSGNKIGVVKASIGISKGSRSNMAITKNNEIDKADFNILNRSQLKLNNGAIPHLKYQLADSAKLILSGAAQKIIKNHP
jgi:hypothetical protein